MQVAGKVVAVTGGGSGIGAALCQRFAAEGAAGVAVLDLDEANAKKVAAATGGLGLGCDVASEGALVAAIARIESDFGPIDLFCSNAGIGIPDPDTSNPASASDEMWERNWRIHVMSHVYAARHLGPRMAARGSGYFLNTISAAGLLTQLGNGPYSATKHAAVAFAESLAIQYGDRGIGVSILCPQGVRTPMVAEAMDTPAVGDGILCPDTVAQCALDGLARERFLILPHPQVEIYMQRKALDYDRWLRGMRRLKSPILDGDLI